MTEVRVHRHEIFATPVWYVDFTFLGPHRVALLADIDESLSDWSAPSVPGHMTRNNLHEQPGPHWDAYRTSLLSLCDKIAGEISPPFTTRTLHTWAIRFDGPEEFGDERSSLHNHARSTYTASLWLSVPPELEASGEGATVLRNPQNHLLHRYGMDTYVRFAPVPLALVLFPSFIEHYPECPQSVTSFGAPRTLLVSDIHYY